MAVTLKELFDSYSDLRTKFACTWVADGTQWWVCPCAFMSKYDKTLKDSPVRGYNNKPSNPVLEAHPEKVYPENTVKVVIENIPDSYADIVYTGKNLLSREGKINKEIPLDIPKCHYNVLLDKVKANWKDFDKADFCIYTKGNLPMLRLTQGDYTFWVIYNKLNREDNLAVTTKEGITYTAHMWSDVKDQYEQFKETKMKFTPETNKIIEQTIGKEFEKIKIDPEKTGKEIKVAAAVEAAAPAPATPPPPVSPEPTVEEPAKEPVKKTRKKAEVTQLTDLTKFIEQLGGAIPEDVTYDKLIEQLRQLRDVQINASRRATNLALQYIERNKGAHSLITW